MRRLLAAAAVAAVGLTVTVPLAWAHNEQYVHDMAWGASPNPATANDGAQVYSNDEVVAAKVHFVDGVQNWDVVIRPVNGGQPSSCHEDLAPDQRGKYPSDVYINCPWDTTRATKHTLPGRTAEAQASDVKFARVWDSQDLGPSVNGKYTIEITALNAGITCGLVTGCQPDNHYVVEPHPLYQSGSNPPRWREVWVTNGVANPAGVNSTFDPGSNRISVTWAPNPEPDVSYIVQEKVGDGKWSAGTGVPGNSTRYDRSIDQPGSYQYRVAAVRPAPTANSGTGASATKKSDYVAAQAVNVAQVTPPTTAGANNADGTPDGGDPGVFIPGDTPAAPGSPAAGPTTPTRSGPAASGPRPSGPASTAFRPSGSSSRPTGTTEPGEAEGEGEDTGFSTVLPYNDPSQQFADSEDGLAEEAGPQTFGGVVPKPHDTRGLMIYIAISLTLFVVAMQLTWLLRKSRPVAAAGAEQYQDDFDEWLGF
jgi:hypothetical protein